MKCPNTCQELKCDSRSRIIETSQSFRHVLQICFMSVHWATPESEVEAKTVTQRADSGELYAGLLEEDGPQSQQLVVASKCF